MIRFLKHFSAANKFRKIAAIADGREEKRSETPNRNFQSFASKVKTKKSKEENQRKTVKRFFFSRIFENKIFQFR